MNGPVILLLNLMLGRDLFAISIEDLLVGPVLPHDRINRRCIALGRATSPVCDSSLPVQFLQLAHIAIAVNILQSHLIVICFIHNVLS